jgi:hypothetical protein
MGLWKVYLIRTRSGTLGAGTTTDVARALAVLQPMALVAQAVADLAACAQALLCLGKPEEARPVVKRLRGCGYVNPDCEAFCKENGLI